MKKPFVCALMLLGCSPLWAQHIVLEPDDYANRTVLDHALPQVSLTLAGTNNLPIPPASIPIWAITSTFPFQPPTGSNVFSAAGVAFFPSTGRLRMDFNGTVSLLSIIFQGGDTLATERGRLDAFDAAGNLLAFYQTQPVLGGQIETMQILRPSADIAWATAYTLPGDNPFGRLDHLEFAVPVPEPGALALGRFAVAALGLRRRRSPSKQASPRCNYFKSAAPKSVL